MYSKDGMEKRVPEATDRLSCGLMVTGTLTIMHGIIQVTLEDATERVWVSDCRLKTYPPNDIPFDSDNLAPISDLDAILEWYDIEVVPDPFFSKRYRYKAIHHHDIADQCTLRVGFKDETTKDWTAHVDGYGHVIKVITDTGKELKHLADLRATGIVEATLISEYDIVNF